jgi:hypothetical protein
MFSMTPKSLVLICMGCSALSLGAGRWVAVWIRRGATKSFPGDTASSRCLLLNGIHVQASTRPFDMRRQQCDMVSNGSAATATGHGRPDGRSQRRLLKHRNSIRPSENTARFANVSTRILAEALVHPVLLTHQHPRHVLIVTTGSTFNNSSLTLGQVLRHQSVERVEIVQMVMTTGHTATRLENEKEEDCSKFREQDHDPRVTYHCVSNVTRRLATAPNEWDVILVEALYVWLVWSRSTLGNILAVEITASHTALCDSCSLCSQSNKCHGQESVSRVEF